MGERIRRVEGRRGDLVEEVVDRAGLVGGEEEVEHGGEREGEKCLLECGGRRRVCACVKKDRVGRSFGMMSRTVRDD